MLEQKGKIIKEWWLNPNKIEDKRVDFLILCVLNGKQFIHLFIFQIGGGMNMKGNGNGNGEKEMEIEMKSPFQGGITEQVNGR